MTALRLSQVRFSATASLARARQKLFMKFDFRTRRISSNTALTAGSACASSSVQSRTVAMSRLFASFYSRPAKDARNESGRSAMDPLVGERVPTELKANHLGRGAFAAFE